MTEMLTAHGNKLLEMCASAKESVFIAAPFIKLSAITRVMEVIPRHISITVVGRFAVKDLQVGVTDLSVVDYIWSRPKSTILLHPLLHAKLYRIDTLSLVGSANLTYKGLGWCQCPNIELLIEIPAEEQNISALGDFLLSTSTEFTKDIYEQLKASCTVEDTSFASESSSKENLIWVPACRRPEFLWEIFRESAHPKCSDTVIKNGKKDLNSLEIPAWMPKNRFKPWIGTLLKMSPFYQKLMEHSERHEMLDDNSALEWLNKDLLRGRDDLTPQDAWENIKAWIKEFSDDMKVIAHHEAIILKSRPKK